MREFNSVFGDSTSAFFVKFWDCWLSDTKYLPSSQLLLRAPVDALMESSCTQTQA